MANSQRFYVDIIDLILSRRAEKSHIEFIKSSLAKQHGLSKIPKNADISKWAESRLKKDDMKYLREFLQTKPVRSGSGVSVIAVMALADCPGKCIYCPRGENAPQSYTGVEPATMRARRVKFDPYAQVKNRIWQLELTGHITDKCELIIMGGTFPALRKKFQENFIKRCFDALNEKKGKSLLAAQKINENAKHRCIGITIETRPDYCLERHIIQMLKMGTTRVEIGVQSTDNMILKKVCRGHTVNDVYEATQLLKDFGLKVCYHMMPGLTGISGKIDMASEKSQFDNIFHNSNFKPDLLKIYPTLVIPNTRLHSLWKSGKFKPLSKNQAKSILFHIKDIVPKWVRIQRMQRDISWEKIEAGPDTTNIRQLIQQEMNSVGDICKCIRCREVGHSNIIPEKITVGKMEYSASGGREIFISFEDFDKGILIGYLRLRFPSKTFIKELEGCSLVRELHVYGQETSLGKRENEKWQHRGYGKALLKEAEKISKENGFDKISVTSGVGARAYYRKLGYKLKGFHMIKIIK